MKILVFNSASSSQKSCLYEIGGSLPENPPPPLWQGEIEWDGDSAKLRIRTAKGGDFTLSLGAESRTSALERLIGELSSGDHAAVRSLSEIGAVGHRIVHGGPVREPSVITPEIRAAIEKASSFAPLHNATELEEIDTVDKYFKNILHVAVFDTGFHRTMSDAASVYPGPYEWLARGIRRYGFHGINHEYVAHRSAQMLGKDLASLKIVSCHLGSGCSLAAVREGHSIDTTMGFTPLEGLMMGTRSGSVDPGILTYLLRQDRLSGEQLDKLLNSRSGLLGISGISDDMREILQAMNDRQPRAKLAFDIFIHRLRSGIGQMLASLGGMDVLIFTAGIGENSPEVRAAACEGFDFLGVRLDPAKNSKPQLDQDISRSESSVRILAIRAQEDWSIAKSCWELAQQEH